MDVMCEASLSLGVGGVGPITLAGDIEPSLRWGIAVRQSIKCRVRARRCSPRLFGSTIYPVVCERHGRGRFQLEHSGLMPAAHKTVQRGFIQLPIASAPSTHVWRGAILVADAWR